MPQKTPAGFRLIMVDSGPLFMRGLHLLLDDLIDGPVELVGQTSDADEARDLVLRLHPDIVVVDLDDDGDRLKLLSRLAEDFPDVARVALVEDEDPKSGWPAVLAGAHVVLPKSADPERTALALVAATSNWVVLPPAVTEDLRVWGDRQHVVTTRLDEDEMELLTAIVNGRPDREVADERGVSTRTVKRHVASLLNKLQVENRSQAAALAGAAGMLPTRPR